MRQPYRDILSADADTRRGLYQTALEAWPTSPALIEKDLMVCAVLDVLFGDVPDAAEKLVFKGGTSLSKAHSLVSRFSEDIDLVVMRGPLGFVGDTDPLASDSPMSGKMRAREIEHLQNECAAYIAAEIVPHLDAAFAGFGATIEIDAADPQTVHLHYQSALGAKNGYNLPTVKIEGGARSATLPARAHTIRPYVSSILGDDGPETPGVQTIDAERTFLDKLLILHGRHCHFRDRGTVYRNANRESRHYYDVAMMAEAMTERALADPALLADVIHHGSLAFSSGWMKYDEAAAGSLQIMPPEGMQAAIAKDYAAMQGMILGASPSFDEILARIAGIADAYARRSS